MLKIKSYSLYHLPSINENIYIQSRNLFYLMPEQTLKVCTKYEGKNWKKITSDMKLKLAVTKKKGYEHCLCE
jgi:hypothetical protein